ncbi:MAG: SIS domain-containing protein [Oscillospiraceae bacterium]|nr:SIS domain-containing protein [Oscillospiraceae bacterium]
MKNTTKRIFENLFCEHVILECVKNDIESAYEIIKTCYAGKKKTLICGNGGSASDSEHIVGEFMKGFMLKRPISSEFKEKLRKIKNSGNIKNTEINQNIAEMLQEPLRSISLVSHSSLITAVSNDIGGDMIFAQQVYGYMDAGDVLVALSTSGNAGNVVNAAITAKAMNGKVIAITGQTGGKLKDICDATIRLPAFETYKIQEYTLPVYHALCAMIENDFFGD